MNARLITSHINRMVALKFARKCSVLQNRLYKSLPLVMSYYVSFSVCKRVNLKKVWSLKMTWVITTITKGLSGNFVWSAVYFIISLFLWSALKSPLKEFPGPIPAGITNFWRLWDVYSGRNGETHLKLHRKHGSVVRLGPNVLSLSDPTLINRVYTTKPAWNKVSETRIHLPLKRKFAE